MKSLASDLLSVSGKRASDAEVKNLIAERALHDSYDDPPFRRYLGSKKLGVDILFQSDRIVDIQIYAQPTNLYSAFEEALPFGIERGMTQQQVHHLLGVPEAFDEFDSKYLMNDKNCLLTVAYDKRGVVRYLSIAPLI